MLVQISPCQVRSVNNSKDGKSQYITLAEAGGQSVFNFSARPNGDDNTGANACDAGARLRVYAESMYPCSVQAEVTGFMMSGKPTADGKPGGSVQLLRIIAIEVKPYKEPAASGAK